MNVQRLWWLFFMLSIFGLSLQVHGKMVSQLRLSNETFLNQDLAKEQRKNFQSFGARLRQNDHQDIFQMDIEAQFAVGSTQMSTLGLHELYLQSENFKVGRAREDWSLADREWKLGVIEPVMRSRPLDPQTQGLTGLFLEDQLAGFRFVLFASPIFLPEQGPSYEITNGQIVSQDPWFQRPPSYVKIFENRPEEQINYNIKKPSETQVVLQKEFGALIQSPKDHPWFIQSSYLYKPNNQIALTYRGYKDLAAAQIDRVNVDIVPKVFYHHVASADFGWRKKAHLAALSVVYDSPEQVKDTEKELYTTPNFKPAVIVSPRVRIDAKYFFVNLSRMQISGGEITEEGNDANSNRIPLTQKYFYRQANSIGFASYTFFGKSQSIEQKLNYIFDDQTTFEIIKYSPVWSLSDLWKIHGEVELINAKQPTVANPQQVYNYVDHDRAYLGVGYVF